MTRTDDLPPLGDTTRASLEFRTVGREAEGAYEGISTAAWLDVPSRANQLMIEWPPDLDRICAPSGRRRSVNHSGRYVREASCLGRPRVPSNHGIVKRIRGWRFLPSIVMVAAHALSSDKGFNTMADALRAVRHHRSSASSAVLIIRIGSRSSSSLIAEKPTASPSTGRAVDGLLAGEAMVYTLQNAIECGPESSCGPLLPLDLIMPQGVTTRLGLTLDQVLPGVVMNLYESPRTALFLRYDPSLSESEDDADLGLGGDFSDGADDAEHYAAERYPILERISFYLRGDKISNKNRPFGAGVLVPLPPVELALSPVPSDSAALLDGDAGMASALGDEIGHVLGGYLDGMLAGVGPIYTGSGGAGGTVAGVTVEGAAIAGISGEGSRRRKGEGEAVRGRRGLGAPPGERAGRDAPAG
ncbi:hypothetical protein THAOC_24474, partial [Thalassiosira oceanica]